MVRNPGSRQSMKSYILTYFKLKKNEPLYSPGISPGEWAMGGGGDFLVKGTGQKSLLNGAAVTGTGNHELVIG